MAKQPTNTVKTLRQVVAESIDSFLLRERFVFEDDQDEVPGAILNIIGALSNYYEEGQLLFPEVLITQNIDIVLSLSFNKKLKLGDGQLTEDSFKLAIKLAAPLCRDGWAIYCDLSEARMEYGVISTEISSTSSTLLQELKRSTRTRGSGACFAYIRRKTATSVEMQGYKMNSIIEFSLNENLIDSDNHISNLAKAITGSAESQGRISVLAYIEKLIGEATRAGHGNLIGVIEDSPGAIQKLKDNLSGGVFLEKPIDIYGMVNDLEEVRTLDSDFHLRAHTSLVRSMINNDGIVVFSNVGKLIGYHLLITSEKSSSPVADIPKHIGGSRTKAFQAMKECGLFIAGFFKSQDGKEDSF